MAESKKNPFPRRFLWGASVSAHQVEGGQHNQWTVWELEHAKTLAAASSYKDSHVPDWEDTKREATNPNNYISGQAVDHFSRYETDFDILKALGMNSFRFSIEWSRIEPKEGKWDPAAIEYYRDYLEALHRRGIEPMVCLFHYTLPVWFAEKGGFEKRSNIKYYLRFVEKVMNELGLRMRYVLTINEPEVYVEESYIRGTWPPAIQSKWRAYKVMKNLIRAHNSAAKIIHASNRRFRVSIAKNSPYNYPGDDAWLSRVSANVWQYVVDDYFLKRVIKNCDFIGVNYYFSNRFYGYRVHNPTDHVSDVDWSLEPSNIQFALERLYAKYKKPIIVTENGLADRNDEQRKWWLGKTLLGLQEAINLGVKVEGYFHWSLLDNFEWAYGKWPKYGLVRVDPETFERKVRPSAKWFAVIIKRIRTQSNGGEE